MKTNTIHTLSTVDAMIKMATPGELALLENAIKQREEKVKGKMKVNVSPYHRHWTIGEYEISHETRRSGYDISEDNCHVQHVYDLQAAVEYIMAEQGWNGFAFSGISSKIAERLQAECEKLVETAKALGQIKDGE